MPGRSSPPPARRRPRERPRAEPEITAFVTGIRVIRTPAFVPLPARPSESENASTPRSVRVTLRIVPDAAADSVRFTHENYLVRRDLFTVIHTNMRVYNDAGDLALYTRMKGFRLKEDLRLYADESMSRELLRIAARNVIDFSSGYDVTDSVSGQLVGTLKRKGLKSMVRDEWLVVSPEGETVATILEDSSAKAIVRRFIDIAAFVMPQRYHAEIDGSTAATYRQNFNPFVQKLSVEFSDPDVKLDRRLGLAAAALLLGVEGRQG